MESTKNLTDNYVAQTWSADDYLFSGDLTKMSKVLDDVQNAVIHIQNTSLPEYALRVDNIESSNQTLTNQINDLNSALQGKQDRGDFATKDQLSVVVDQLNNCVTEQSIDKLGVKHLGQFATSAEAQDEASKDQYARDVNVKILTYQTNGSNGIILNNVTPTKTFQQLLWNGQHSFRVITYVEQSANISSWKKQVNVSLPGAAVNTSLLYKLNQQSSSQDVKAALTNNVTKYVLSADDLDQCLVNGYSLKDYVMQGSMINVGWNGQAYTITTINVSSPSNTVPVIRTIAIKIEGDVYSVHKPVNGGTIVTKQSLSSQQTIVDIQERLGNISDVVNKAGIPLVCNVPIRSLQDRVYSKAQILAWFGVDDQTSLKKLVSTNPFTIKYGVELDSNPRYYFIPMQYVAFETDSSIKMMGIGLDTTNDKPSTYSLTIRLDGSIVQSSSNVKLTVTNM